jgi:hypothetical protein
METALKLLKFAGNDEGVRPSDLAIILNDFLALSGLRGNRKRITAAGRTFHFTDNRSFWNAAVRFYEGATISLDDFAVMEWAPASPGRYYTPEAKAARKEALRFLDPYRPEYLPLGKMNMVLGGVGSVRLGAISTAGERAYVLGASSTVVSHEGLPVCLGSDLYREVIPFLKDHGACDCTIIGRLELLPEDVVDLDFPIGVPRFVVRADDIKDLRPTSRRAFVSVSVLYLGAAREYETGYASNRNVGWTFATFDPAARDAEAELKRTADWLKEYAVRHSVLDNPPIVCDFDRHVRHFGDEVVFRLDDIVKGGIDIDLLRRFMRKFGLTINVEQVGDRFENIVNSEIANRSVLFRD